MIAFSLLLAISLAVAIAGDIIDELRRCKDTADALRADLHMRSVKSVLTKEEIEMLLERQRSNWTPHKSKHISAVTY